MECNDTALFAKLPLHHHHLVPGNFRGTVDTADVPLFFGFVVLGGIVHHISQPL